MKKCLSLLLLLMPFLKLNAQSYTKLTDSALHIMWEAKDSTGYRNSLNLYEKAFKLYPAEVNVLGLYKASVISAELMEYDKAFNYLNELINQNSELETTWNYLTFTYPQNEYKNLFNDKRWEVTFEKAEKLKRGFYDNLKLRQKEFQLNGISKIADNQLIDGKQLYHKITSFNDFKSKKYKNYSIMFNLAEGVNTSYFIDLPENYNPKKKYPILFFLHGAVQNNRLTDYQMASSVLEDWNRYYTKYAAINEVIMVYPKASKKYNWMGPDDGFFMIPAMLKEIKQSINVDDDRVFITGHSNGATGSFSYLMKQQSPFAGFYGFNTQPKVRTGGTFIRNILNRSYFNVSTDEDYYYPPDANDSLNVIMKKMGADYQDHRYNGWPHWFPQFDESEPAYPILFKDLVAKKRNPFQKNLYWACDDLKYGKADWIEITQMDTLRKPADWHKNINFDILKLVNYDQKRDTVITTDTLIKAFNFPRKSAAVKAKFDNNQFHLQTSAVKQLKIFISPEMVDMSKPVSVYVNGVKKMEKKVSYNKTFMLENFNQTFDRKAVWVDYVTLEI
ncbi:hypothetical protein [Pedobacter nototheniae]|uniref:hypothetical protein n=1 Tax=Pedobacter nototheniae TaxID=2488994 RepID=UPI00292D19F2|nr:hypothetical protein [Pedobacter nototheniae]